MMNKTFLRNEIKQKVNGLEPSYRIAASATITQLLLHCADFQSADRVFIYLSTQFEPSTDEIIRYALKHNKDVFVPLVTGNGLMQAVKIQDISACTENRFGIREPVQFSDVLTPEKEILCIVPCISVTENGIRLGHGGGYYDRFLSAYPAKTVCLCFERVISEALPKEEHDIMMQKVLTEQGIYECSARNCST